MRASDLFAMSASTQRRTPTGIPGDLTRTQTSLQPNSTRLCRSGPPRRERRPVNAFEPEQTGRHETPLRNRLPKPNRPPNELQQPKSHCPSAHQPPHGQPVFQQFDSTQLPTPSSPTALVPPGRVASRTTQVWVSSCGEPTSRWLVLCFRINSLSLTPTSASVAI